MLFQIIEENGVKKIQALTADTGAGAPVGSIIVVCSNILPSGYLGLGVQYDITNYPALYQVLGTDTTPTASALGLPTLSSGQYAIKATSGLTENQQENVLNTINENLSYSTTEHFTGRCTADGKKIYSKTLICAVDTSGYTNHGISNLLDFTKIEAISKASNGQYRPIPFAFPGDLQWACGITIDDTKVTIEAGINFKSFHTSATVTLEYTKTTDN